MTKKIILSFCLAASTTTLFSCVRAEKNATANLTLSFATPPTSMHANQLNPDGTINPTSLTDLNCYVVAVSGPEAAMSSSTCSYKSTAAPFPVGKLRGGFYVGTSSASTDTTTVEVKDIPIGSSRTIRLIGFKVAPPSAADAPSYCTGFIGSDAMQKYVSDPFQISQVDGVELKGGTAQVVDMTAAFDSTKKIGDCSGPAFPNNGTGGSSATAVKFGISFADGMSTLATLNPNSCVPVRFQLQDANGNRALAASTVTGLIQKTISSQYVGEFYGFGDRLCYDAQMSSSDITQVFHNASGDFTDVIFMYKPNIVASTDGSLSITDAGSTGLQPGNIAFHRSFSGTSAAQFGIYDLFSHESSFAVATSRVVTAGDCRQAAVQFYDSAGVPVVVSTSTGPYRNIIVSSDLSAAQIKFYPGSDCTGGSGDHTIALPVPPYTTLGGVKFYYMLAKPNAVNTFQMQAFNDPASGAIKVVASGDMTSGLQWLIK